MRTSVQDTGNTRLTAGREAGLGAQHPTPHSGRPRTEGIRLHSTPKLSRTPGTISTALSTSSNTISSSEFSWAASPSMGSLRTLRTMILKNENVSQHIHSLRPRNIFYCNSEHRATHSLTKDWSWKADIFQLYLAFSKMKKCREYSQNYHMDPANPLLSSQATQTFNITFYNQRSWLKSWSSSTLAKDPPRAAESLLLKHGRGPTPPKASLLHLPDEEKVSFPHYSLRRSIIYSCQKHQNQSVLRGILFTLVHLVTLSHPPQGCPHHQIVNNFLF